MGILIKGCDYFLEYYFHLQLEGENQEVIRILEFHLASCMPCTIFYENELRVTSNLTARLRAITWEEPPESLLLSLAKLRSNS